MTALKQIREDKYGGMRDSRCSELLILSRCFLSGCDRSSSHRNLSWTALRSTAAGGAPKTVREDGNQRCKIKNHQIYTTVHMALAILSFSMFSRINLSHSSCSSIVLITIIKRKIHTTRFWWKMDLRRIAAVSGPEGLAVSMISILNSLSFEILAILKAPSPSVIT